MLMAKSLIESVLAESMDHNDGQRHFCCCRQVFLILLRHVYIIDSLGKLVDALNIDIENVKANVTRSAEHHLDELRPEMKKSEDFTNKVNALLDHIDLIRTELDDQVSAAPHLNCNIIFYN